ncbi:hypothetical protein QBZ16_004303 [Prototheca wickerhamii]|uniref:RNA helicase n=1 Tax=Prototheca wickerhamii TaxID=3111 RepID=A0AAD9IH34_PROWI|nr:hypothetical protein QBZ16_004303 [Prototheca wickerhamii]
MPRSSSKRQRKQKNKISLAVKQFQRPINVPEDALVAEEDGIGTFEEGPNALILPGKRQGGGQKSAEPETEAPAVKLSKSQKRKLKKIEEDKEKKRRRAGLLKSLAESALDSVQLRALHSVTGRGQKETKKQRLARKRAQREAGLAVSSDEEEEAANAGSDTDDLGFTSSSEEEEETEAERVARLKRLAARGPPRPLFASKPEPQESEAGAGTAPAPVPVALSEALQRSRASLGLDGSRSDEEEDGPRPIKPSVPAAVLPKPRVVSIQRPAAIQEVREKLPILGMEQEIMELVAEHDVLVLSGETGCGKTTQVPQFLLEGGYGCARFPERAGAVAITQPRRIGAIATATRVAEELDSALGTVVGYQVRHDKAVGHDTALKFMTDGILLRELQHDFLLGRYSVVLVDEAHERSLNTDILLGKAARGLLVEDFLENQRLFSRPPPLITVPARQFPVTVHFSRRTEMVDYVKAAQRKVAQIHRMLPPGGILVFLTGQAEVRRLCRSLASALRPKRQESKGADAADDDGGAEEAIEGAFGGDAAEAAGADDYFSEEDDEEYADDFDASDDEEETVEVMDGAGFTPEQIAAAEAAFEERLGIRLASVRGEDPEPGGEGREKQDVEPSKDGSTAPAATTPEPAPVHILPLYALLSSEAQARVFDPPPPGARLIVVATNVAETSLTIPGIRYVVDAGRAKRRVLESSSTGMARYEVGWVSQASAAQRAGRAGRTGPGHCYRLFSSAVFNDAFAPHAAPEILGVPQESVVLALKAMGVARVANFPFPTPPERAALASAVRTLALLGALDPGSEALTPAGAGMAALPINPRHAKLILYATRAALEAARSGEGKEGGRSARSQASDSFGLLMSSIDAALSLAAVLSVESPFLAAGTETAAEEKDPADESDADPEDAAAQAEAQKEEARRRREAQAALRDETSDALSALRALCAFLAHGRSAAWAAGAALHARHLEEGVALRAQLARLVARSDAFSPRPRPGTTPRRPRRCAPRWRRWPSATWSATRARPRSRARRGCCCAARCWPAGRTASRGASARPSTWPPRRPTRRARGARSGTRRRSWTSPCFCTRPRPCTAPRRAFLSTWTWCARPSGPTCPGSRPWRPTGSPRPPARVCRLGDPLPAPPPFYSPRVDAVLAWHETTFGRHDWPLPRVTRPHPALATRCAAFAAALLQGAAEPALEALAAGLVVDPGQLSRPEAQAHPRVSNLLFALERAGVDSRAALEAALGRDPRFLGPELRALYRPAYADRVAAALAGVTAAR